MISSVQFTAFYAGLLTLFYVALSIRIIMLRRELRIGIGHGESNRLHRVIRVHANFAEFVPLALLLLMFLELNGTESWVLNVLGTMLLVGRLLHSMGLSKSAGTSVGRLWGGLLTYSMMIIASVLNIMVMYTV
jgi:uncharacterized protein